MRIAHYFTLFFLITISAAIPLLGIARMPQEPDEAIKKLYHKLSGLPTMNMPERIKWISKQLINKPYLLGALGEGAQAQFDQFPLYRMDAFDCETFVDTVLAVAFSINLNSFQQCIRNIRYQSGVVSFVTRNHFTCIDWNKNNQKQYFIKDITRQFTNKSEQKIAKIATAIIDKPSWYRHLSNQAIRIKAIQPAEAKQRLVTLQNQSKAVSSEISTIAYLPLSILFDEHGEANMYVFKQIPQAAIIEIIRPNWDLRNQIGTALNVSHLGFAIWEHDKLWFRQASSILGKTTDIDLITYLKQAKKSPTIKGINVQLVLPQQTLNRSCAMSQSYDIVSPDSDSSIEG
ncbi:MAG: N-acetylmuramoyl-L-alanine amidase-like domain-containing protein [Legionella sp.]